MSGINVYFVYFHPKVKCRRHLGLNVTKFVSFSMYLCPDGTYITYHTYDPTHLPPAIDAWFFAGLLLIIIFSFRCGCRQLLFVLPSRIFDVDGIIVVPPFSYPPSLLFLSSSSSSRYPSLMTLPTLSPYIFILLLIWSEEHMTQSRSPLSTTKLKVRSAGVIKRQSTCYHVIVAMAVSEQEPFLPSLLSPGRDRNARPSDQLPPSTDSTPPPSDQLEAILARRSESLHPITSAALLTSSPRQTSPFPLIIFRHILPCCCRDCRRCLDLRWFLTYYWRKGSSEPRR